MVENCLVVSCHGLSEDQLLPWITEHVGEVARCHLLAHDQLLLEFVLENELDIAKHRFIKHFPHANARVAVSSDYASLPLEPEGVLEHRLGGVNDVRLRLSTGPGGGTGSKLWSGGLLLAEWIMHDGASGSPLLPFVGHEVLELGAGSAALPSVAAASRGARKVVATDGIVAVVEQMRNNLAHNAPSVEVRTLDWLTAGRKSYAYDDQFDLILFSDGIYTQRGALFLADAITSLLRPSGVVVAALPDFRAGIAGFEEDLSARGFITITVDLSDVTLRAASEPIEKDEVGMIVGEELEGYRVVMWRLEEAGDSDVSGEGD